MPSSDSRWRQGPTAASTQEPQTTPASQPWRRNNISAAPRGLDPTAQEFTWRPRPVAASSDTSLDTQTSEASTPTSTSPASSPATSLSSSPSASERSVSPQSARVIQPGFIYKARIQDARNASSLLILQQPHVNGQVERHPTMVWDVYEVNGQKIARCLQMTSFGKLVIEQKYAGHNWRHHCQYLPVQQGGTTSRTNSPILELQDGKKMKSQSYVHLDHFFEIEARFLGSWSGSASLTPGSLDVLRAKLIQYAQGGIYRNLRCNNPSLRSPLDTAGPPEYSNEVRQAAARGRALEEIRRASLWTRGERIYTGLENQRDSPK